ncbi:hypothetical protein H7F51_16445 [Novosphingobium flavum]|uniref:Type VI secretion system spike protein VgrG3-like C-terminal domain-containing protein n=1 Tax=Novosphingobium flavum TaxID=1778672 RepID=A0A7X1KN93_9SPHN|nr:hypothetical protein [Novosphingobium flavum]MBC2667110.1 hypothetical protein [Novosphingobium flavum]
MDFDFVPLRDAEKAVTGAPDGTPSGLDGLAEVLAQAAGEAEPWADTPAATPSPAPISPHRLGSLSERYESGGRGPGTVSSGLRDPGGVSYGLYQMATRTGTAASFVAAEGAAWGPEFRGKAPGSAAFTAAWQAIAAREAPAFAQAQHAFIERTHYRPVVTAVRAGSGLDLDSRADAVRDACWSCAVQHGAAAKVLLRGIAAADKACPRADPGYDRALIEAIYAQRTAYVRDIAAGSDPGAARTLLDIAARRYPSERAAALAMLG